MVEYLCDTCNKRARESIGHYVRCRYFGDTKKRIKCVKHFDENIVADKMVKRDMLGWCNV